MRMELVGGAVYQTRPLCLSSRGGAGVGNRPEATMVCWEVIRSKVPGEGIMGSSSRYWAVGAIFGDEVVVLRVGFWVMVSKEHLP